MTLERYNVLWSPNIGRDLTEQEFNTALEEYPDLDRSYSLQEIVAAKHATNEWGEYKREYWKII